MGVVAKKSASRVHSFKKKTRASRDFTFWRKNVSNAASVRLFYSVSERFSYCFNSSSKSRNAARTRLYCPWEMMARLLSHKGERDVCLADFYAVPLNYSKMLARETSSSTLEKECWKNGSMGGPVELKRRNDPQHRPATRPASINKNTREAFRATPVSTTSVSKHSRIDTQQPLHE